MPQYLDPDIYLPIVVVRVRIGHRGFRDDCVIEGGSCNYLPHHLDFRAEVDDDIVVETTRFRRLRLSRFHVLNTWKS